MLIPYQRFVQTMYPQNRRQGDMNNVPLALSASSSPQGMESLSSRLAAAPLPQQKQMLGERLFPLVQNHKVILFSLLILRVIITPRRSVHFWWLIEICWWLQADLASKITGMLLEMDNSELLLLLESPESLAAKVEEAVQVLELSKSEWSENSSS